MKRRTCCFLGHRKIENTDILREKLFDTVKKLIVEENIDTFLFGSKSQFNDLCHQIVSKLKTDYPHLKRVYVRAEFPYINDDYKEYLLQSYEETYFPDNIINAGKAVYVERNYEMIDKSSVCIMYFDENYAPSVKNRKDIIQTNYQPKSGTRIVYDYALRKQCTVFNVFK